ncbi:MAG: septal ring lytic transglycosylase RlpA family protein [Saprospiraceae bacterium]|nr:septal ring lytic transglycosylase RlpA family protein [Saprospiraceae bacterium]
MKQSFTYLVLFSLLLSTPIFSQSIVNNVEAGTALYYADYLEGRRTASGEVFKQSELTCAHKTYPFGTWLRVTRLDNQQSVTVRVNDRGPFCEGCVVDLSKSAAARINLLQAGRAEVKVEAMGVTQTAPTQSTAEQLTARGGTNIPQSFSTSSNRIPSTYSNVPQSYSSVPQNNTIRRRTTTAQSSGTSTLSQWEQDLRNRTSSQVRPRTYSYTSPTLSSRAPANTNAVSDREFTAKGTTARSNVPTNYSWSPNTAIRGDASRTNTAPSTTRTPEAIPANYSYVPSASSGYGVQVASYANYNNADKRQRTVYAKGINNVFIKQGKSRKGDQVFRVVVGPFSDQGTAAQSLQQLKRTYNMRGFVVNLAK